MQLKRTNIVLLSLMTTLSACASHPKDAGKKQKKNDDKPSDAECGDNVSTDSGTETATAKTEKPGSNDKQADGQMPGMPGMAALADSPSSKCGKSSDPTGKPGSQAISAIKGDALFVVNGGANSISVIDPKSFTIIGSIALSNVSFPHHLNLDPAAKQIVVAVPGMDLSGGHDGAGMAGMKGSILVLDAKTGATKASRTFDAMNHNGIFSPNGKEVWTAQMKAPGSVLILDSSTLATQKEVAVGDMPAEVTFSQDGKFAFVANGGSASVTVIDVSTKKVIDTIKVGEEPVGAWQGTDGTMYVDNEKGRTISAIDAKSLKVTRTYDLGFTPGLAATAPSGELWVSDADNGKVVYFMAGMDMKSGEIKTGAGAHAITFSPDGSMAYVTNQFDGSVSMIDANAHKLIKNLKTGSKPNGILYRAN